MSAAFVAEVGAFCAAARRRQLRGPAACARRAAELLRLLVANGRHPDPCSLIADVRKWGAEMQAAAPLELSIGNMVRRVLHMIREESADECSGGNNDSDRDAFADGRLPSALAFAASASFGSGGNGGNGGNGGSGGSSAFGGFGGASGGGGGAADALAARAGGLLSRALRPGGRNVSLHNLLDNENNSLAAVGGIGGAGIVSPTSPMSPAAAAATSGSSKLPPSPKQPRGTTATTTTPQQQRKSGKSSKLPPWPGRAGVIEQLNELIDELDEMDTAIAMRAGDHIHANEIVLTLGHDPTTLLFLLEAAKRRTFQVVVAEAAPSYSGRKTAVALARAGIATTLIADAAIFAVMARVHKVVIAARALLADGGVLAPAGARVVAAAAARHAAPFVALCGLHCLSPLFPHDPALATNDFGDPGDVLDYASLPVAQAAPTRASVEAARALAIAVAEGGRSAAGSGGDGRAGSKSRDRGDGAAASASSASPSSSSSSSSATAAAASAAAAAAAATCGLPHVLSPQLDVVPPDLVSLLVTDTGCYTPSYVYRLLAEYYSREDYSI